MNIPNSIKAEAARLCLALIVVDGGGTADTELTVYPAEVPSDQWSEQPPLGRIRYSPGGRMPYCGGVWSADQHAIRFCNPRQTIRSAWADFVATARREGVIDRATPTV